MIFTARHWAFVAAAILPAAQSACIVSSDFSGTSFLCQEEPTCPDGFECVAGVCERPASSTDGGGDAAKARRSLTFDNSGRGELANMPVLVSVDPSTINYDAAGAGGASLEFADADGNVLAHEIESWNPGGQSHLWVRVPNIGAGTTSEFIWMVYGGDAGAGQDSQSLWSDYRAVYHMSGSGDGGVVSDSTAQGYDGTPVGGGTSIGAIGDARSFNGVDEFVNLGTDRDFATGATAVTFSGWLRPDQLEAQVVAFGASVNGGVASRVQVLVRTDLVVNGGGRTEDIGDIVTLDGGTITVGVWTWVVMVMDMSTDTISIYFNGNLANSASVLGLGQSMPNTSSTQAVIGADENLTANFWRGDIDEIRIDNQLRDQDWISAQYASMTDALVTIGGEESAP